MRSSFYIFIISVQRLIIPVTRQNVCSFSNDFVKKMLQKMIAVNCYKFFKNGTEAKDPD